MVLTYCIVPLVLGIGSFTSLMVEAHASLYLLNCIVHIGRSFKYTYNDVSSNFSGLVAKIRENSKNFYKCSLLKN